MFFKKFPGFLNFAILSVLMSLMISACITVDKYGRPVKVEETTRKEPGKLKLSEVAIRPDWSKEESILPIVIAGLPREVPKSFMLKNLPPVGNQGVQPSGTAWAVGYTATTMLMLKSGIKHYRCSPAFIYNQLNTKNRGIETMPAVQLLKKTGCSDINTMPYNQYDYSTKPKTHALQNAERYKINGYGRVDFTDINQVRAHLLQGSVVITTLRVTKSFVTLQDKEWQTPEGFYMGRHTIAVVGYDHNKQVFILQNSAGPKWGKYGYAHIPYEWFIRLAGQAYVIW